MKFRALLAAGTAVVTVSAYAAVPAKKPAAAAKDPPPIANYWMDVSTMSGFGAGMMGGGKPSLGQIMGMMNGGGSSVGHMLNLRLASREKPTGDPQANHFIPPAMQMGASLPLVTPPPPKEVKETYEPSTPGTYEKPKGRMLIYWGCGEHAAAPVVIDFATMAEGKIPPGIEALSKMGRAMGRTMAHEPRPGDSAGFGEWPNAKDSRPVPSNASLIGPHRIEGNYSPAMSFTMAPGQDFMPGLGLHEAGATPAGGDRLDWTVPAQATGYSLAMFGANSNQDIIIWTSAKSAAMAPMFDYLEPSEVKSLIAQGAVLPPTQNECILPTEVAQAVPQGMIMMIGYGPQAWFSDKPKAPTWTTRVRYKTTDMLMRGMGGMMGATAGGQQPQASAQGQQQPQPEQKKKRRGFGLGDMLKGAIPLPQ